VMSQFDIGIAPLDDIVFNHAKSWLKGLEYAALGIPFVASDLPEYVRLEKQHGIGVTAPSKSKAWRRRVGDLMSAGEGREALGQAYRTIVASTLTIERNAWRWPEAWQRAIEERRRRTANTRARPK
jgi:glycosyltransferase involved in cell wall biosynthesis